MDSLLVNDVPRIYVADKCNVEQATEDTSAVDREDKTFPEAADADQEDLVQRPSVPKRKRKVLLGLSRRQSRTDAAATAVRATTRNHWAYTALSDPPAPPKHCCG